jgi:hypothetical protein
MSNDDIPDSFIKFIKELKVDRKPFVIVALCPSFLDDVAKTDYILDTLHDRGYALFFWVLQKQYKKSAVVQPEEIERLREYGDVVLYDGEGEGSVRAQLFQAQVAKWLTA